MGSAKAHFQMLIS